MIFLDSRYAEGRIFKAYNPTKDSYELTVFREYPESVSEVIFYEWVDSDRIDLIASKYFGDAEYWWKIMDFNPEITNPFEITPGTIIRIPINAD